MTKTTNYQLNQWGENDYVRRADFNADNQKIDAALANAGNCKIKFGSYVGTGTAGTSNPVTLNFDIEPVLVILAGSETHSESTKYYIAHRNSAVICSPTYRLNGTWTYGRPLYLTWGEKSLSFYVDIDVPEAQFNKEGQTYSYIVFGI